MKRRALLACIGALLPGCVVKHTTPENRTVRVEISPFEKTRAKSVARQFFLAYMGGETKEPNQLTASDFKKVEADLSATLDAWSVLFFCSKDPIIVEVELNRDMTRAYLSLNDAPVIPRDRSYRPLRTLDDFRRVLAEDRKQNSPKP